MRLALLAVTIVTVSIAPAHASIGVFCSGPDGVSFDAPLSGGVGLTVMSATVEAAGKVWTTETALEDPQAIVPAQTWGGGDFMWFDFSDTNLEANVVEVRILMTDDGAQGGTLEVKDFGSWVISCDLG